MAQLPITVWFYCFFFQSGPIGKFKKSFNTHFTSCPIVISWDVVELNRLNSLEHACSISGSIFAEQNSIGVVRDYPSSMFMSMGKQ